MLKLRTCLVQEWEVLVPRPPGRAGRHPEVEPQNSAGTTRIQRALAGRWIGLLGLPSHQRANACLSQIPVPNHGGLLRSSHCPLRSWCLWCSAAWARDSCSCEEGRTFTPLAPPELGETEAQLRDSRPDPRSLSEEIKIVVLDFRFPVLQSRMASMAGLLFFPSRDRPKPNYYLQELPSPGMAA